MTQIECLLQIGNALMEKTIAQMMLIANLSIIGWMLVSDKKQYYASKLFNSSCPIIRERERPQHSMPKTTSLRLQTLVHVVLASNLVVTTFCSMIYSLASTISQDQQANIPQLRYSTPSNNIRQTT